MLRVEKEIRERNVSQSELSRRTGMHVSSINNILRGRMIAFPGQRAKITKALHEMGYTGSEAELFSEVECDE